MLRGKTKKGSKAVSFCVEGGRKEGRLEPEGRNDMERAFFSHNGRNVNMFRD